MVGRAVSALFSMCFFVNEIFYRRGRRGREGEKEE